MSKILEIKDRRIAFYIKARKMHFIDFESIDSFMRYDHEYGFSNVVSVFDFSVLFLYTKACDLLNSPSLAKLGKLCVVSCNKRKNNDLVISMC